MKAKDIVVGGIYSAMVSGKLSRVKVTRIFSRETGGYMSSSRMATRYACVNLKTGRNIEVKSAQRFRSLILSEDEKAEIIRAAERRAGGAGARPETPGVILPLGPIVNGQLIGTAEDSACFGEGCDEAFIAEEKE